MERSILAILAAYQEYLVTFKLMTSQVVQRARPLKKYIYVLLAVKGLMGDMNAKTGSCNIGHEEVMGSHGLGDMNNNEERFADLCAEHELVVGGSVFAHKSIHKATRVSPNYTAENQVGNLWISRKFRRILLDVFQFAKTHLFRKAYF